MSKSVGGAFVPSNSYNRAGAVDSNVSSTAVLTNVPADGPLAIAPGTVYITKPSAAALTLGAPTAAQVGFVMVITAGSAFAHVVTATGLIDNGVTGGPHNTWTGSGFQGSGITLQAMPSLRWSVIAQVGGVVA